MADEKEDSYEMPEEGEYHFTDEEVNYEADKDTAKATVKTSAGQSDVLARLKPYRRTIIGVVVFFALIFVIYKMLTPASTLPPTEFTPATVAQPITTQPKAPKPLVPVVTQAQAMPTQPPQPAAQPMMMAQPGAPMQPPGAPIQSTQPPGAPAPTIAAPTAPGPEVSTPMMMQAQTPPPVVGQPTQPMVATPPPPLTGTPAGTTDNMMTNRVSALEDQNAKVLDLIQTQVAQKISEYQMENAALRERVSVLNKRLANMEATLNKLSQMIQDRGVVRAQATMVAELPPSGTVTPKMVYTVQAIIPGRAWLKSDAGDTVTVAEGDILKDYGRVTKIDPYDGVVEIDTGRKTIALAYGSSGD